MGNAESTTLAASANRQVMVHKKLVTTKFIKNGSDLRPALEELVSVIRDQNTRSIVGMELYSGIAWGVRKNISDILVLCSGTLCLIIKLHDLGYGIVRIPDCLASFLDLPDLTFVGMGMENNRKKLLTDHSLEVKNAADLATVARTVKSYHPWKLPYACGLYELVAIMFGVRLSHKPASVMFGSSSWHAKDFDPELIKYATYDGYCSFAAGFRLMFDDNRFGFQ